MTKYTINYTFDGYGIATVEADSQEEAVEKFENGDANYDEDDLKQGDASFEITKITPTK